MTDINKARDLIIEAMVENNEKETPKKKYNFSQSQVQSSVYALLEEFGFDTSDSDVTNAIALFMDALHRINR